MDEVPVLTANRDILKEPFCKYSISQTSQPAGSAVYDQSQLGTEDTFCTYPISSQISVIIQCDGADTVSDVSDNGSTCTDSDTDDEPYVEREPAVLVPAAAQPPASQPLLLEVDESVNRVLPASLPLVMLTNARSVFNKANNLRK